MNKNNNHKITLIENLKTRARLLEERYGAESSAPKYAACIAGMWAHVLKVPRDFAQKDSVDINSWFLTGFDASEMAAARLVI